MELLKRFKISGRKSLEVLLSRMIAEEEQPIGPELRVIKEGRKVVIVPVEVPKPKVEKAVSAGPEVKKVKKTPKKVEKEPESSGTTVIKEERKKKSSGTVPKPGVDVGNMKFVDVYDVSQFKNMIPSAMWSQLQVITVKQAKAMLKQYRSVIERAVPNFNLEDYRR